MGLDHTSNVSLNLVSRMDVYSCRGASARNRMDVYSGRGACTGNRMDVYSGRGACVGNRMDVYSGRVPPRGRQHVQEMLHEGHPGTHE